MAAVASSLERLIILDPVKREEKLEPSMAARAIAFAFSRLLRASQLFSCLLYDFNNYEGVRGDVQWNDRAFAEVGVEGWKGILNGELCFVRGEGVKVMEFFDDLNEGGVGYCSGTVFGAVM